MTSSPPITAHLRVQVGDGEALIGPRVVAREGGAHRAEPGDPRRAVHARRVAATLSQIFSFQH